MVWIKIIYPVIVFFKKVFKKKGKPAPPACGPNSTANEQARSKSMEKKRKEKQQKAAEKLKLVVSGAKITCPLCTVPMGTFVVTDLNPTVQNKAVATESDTKKTNFIFTGTCMKTPNMAGPCVGAIVPGKWRKTGSLKVQNKAPLLFKSSIKCMFGSVDLKFMHSGQMMPPFAYDSPGPDRKTKPEEVIDIRISVFFDGTGNNRFNTECRKEHENKEKNLPYNAKKAAIYEKKGINMFGKEKDNSFGNDFTNVARMSKHYKEILKDQNKRCGYVYVEGVGTKDESRDGILSLSMGYGFARGVRNKVEDGCALVAKKIKELIPPEKKLSTLTIDVFGFSRGAAAARNFIHEITQDAIPAHTEDISTEHGVLSKQVGTVPAHGELGRQLKIKGVEFKMLNLNFAGLFDTVSAYGINHKNDVEQLNLTAISKVRHVLHLTAMDERRANFPLITVKNSKGSYCEKALPGVHSDVGGSYNYDVNEECKVFAGTSEEIKIEEDFLISDGWFTKDQLDDSYITRSLVKNIYNPGAGINGLLTGKRENLSNEYSFIPLFIMHDKASNKPIYMKFKGDINSAYEVPPALDKINKRLTDYVLNDGNPIKFYSRQSLENEIFLIELKENPNLGLDLREEFMRKNEITPKDNARVVTNTKYLDYKNTQTSSSTESLTDTEVLPQKLDPKNYKNHPELQQKIKDHNLLIDIRNKYIHTSHSCSLFGDLVNYMDPFSRSVRDAKIREHYDG